MNLKIISWNVRGMNEKDKRLQIRNLIRIWQANVIWLQEELITRGFIKSLWGCLHVNWVYLSSIGASGGILVKCGIGQWWRSWKKLWVNFWCLVDLGMWEIILNGLSLVCMVLMYLGLYSW